MSATNQKELWLMRRVLGVLAASLLVTIIVSASIFFTEDVKHAGLGSFLIAVLATWPTILIWATAGYLLVGAPILMLFRWRKIQHWSAFAIAGAVVGCLSWVFPWGIIEWDMKFPPKQGLFEGLLVSNATYMFTISGFFCGIIYWLIVYRKAPSYTDQ